MQISRWLLTFGFSAVIAACGGGGGGGGSSHSSNNTNTPSTTTTTPTAPTGDNVQAISVNAGPTRSVNLAFTSVTVCVPGTSQCKTIDNVFIDTGSSGLRVLASALNGLTLPQQTTAANNPLVECLQFVDLSHVWGPVKLADVKIGGKTASSVQIQAVGDSAFSNEPVTCAGGDSDGNMNTVAKLGGNGILGVSTFTEDCGDYCANIVANNLYYDCVGSSCVRTAATLASQVKNPVAMFPDDNNGVIIDLPAISGSGSTRADGWMIFGIGTRANNALGSATIYTLSSVGYLSTEYKGLTYPRSFIDSGSNGLFFPDPTIRACTNATGFFCPPSTLHLSAKIIGLNDASASIAFNVANAEALNGNNFAFNDLAGPFSSGFDWGLPFFFGRKVYTSFETNSDGSYVAF